MLMWFKKLICSIFGHKPVKFYDNYQQECENPFIHSINVEEDTNKEVIVKEYMCMRCFETYLTRRYRREDEEVNEELNLRNL